MDIIFPTNTTEIIDDIRDAIGRPVTFYRDYRVPCSACSIDPVTDTSTNSFCLVCSGVGYIITPSGAVLTAVISHGPAEQMRWVTGGQYFDGDCLIQVKYSAINIAIIDNAEYLDVDNQHYTVKNKILRGVPTVNRVLLNLMERK